MIDPTNPNVADWLDDGGGGDPSTRRGDTWSPRVKDQAAYALNAWCAWLDTRGIKLLEAGRRDFRKWMDERTAEGVKASTRRKEWFYVSAFYTNAAIPVRKGGLGLLAEDPMDTVRGPKVSGRPTTRTAKPDEVDALVAYFSQQASLDRAGGEAERARRNVAMVSLMFRSGCRSGELPAMDLDDLVTIDGHRAIKLYADDTKSGEPRLVPVTKETSRYLDRYLRLRGNTPGPLFRGREGKTRTNDDRLTARAVQDVIKRAARKLDVPVSAHQLRRGFVAQYLRAGGDGVSLEVIGGWADPRMPARYLADERDAAAIARFHAVTDGGNRLRAV